MADNPLLDEELGQAVAGLDPFQALGTSLGLNPLVNPIPEIDATGLVAPLGPGSFDLTQTVAPMEQMPGGVPPVAPDTLVLDNQTGLLTPGGFPEGVNQPTVPGSTPPRMVDREIGSTSTSTSRTERTPGAVEAEKSAFQAAQDAEDAMLAKADADAKLIEAQAQAADRDNQVIAEVETARAAARQDAVADVQMKMLEIDQRMNAMLNEPPQTFWGDKSTADKVTAALSVGLGSFGQALLGSGENVGMTLLKRSMSEFDTIQERKRQNQLKQLETLKTSADMRLKLADEIDKSYDAKKLAARAKAAAEMSKMATMAKTAQVKSQAAVQVAQLDQELAKMRMDNEARYATKVTENQEKKVYEKIKMQGSVGPDGKPQKLTEGEAKSRMAYADVLSANQILKDFDLVKLSEDFAFNVYQGEKDLRQSVDRVPIAGSVFGGLMDLQGTAEESLRNRNPKAMEAVSAMTTWVDSVTRLKTGAAIQPDEIEKERRKYFPVRGDTPQVIRNKAETRARWEKALKEAAGIYD